MEQEISNLENVSHLQEQIRSSRKNAVHIGLSIGLAITIGSSVATYLIMSNRLATEEQKLVSLQQSINGKIDEISSKLNSLKLDDIKSQMEYLSERTFWNEFQHDLEGGTVTDEFAVEKATFFVLPKLKDGDKNKIVGTIDINTQPSMSLKYTGQGKFSITDRDLKNAVNDLLNAVSKSYASNTKFRENMPLWKDGEINVTIKNYDIGSYSNGEFKLKGE